ncbi:Histone deacetylase [Prescottella defluvii]
MRGARTVGIVQVWYVSYGSNMSWARLDCYLRGGRPVGGGRTYLGARDPGAPADRIGVRLPGTVYFAGESLVWGGGRAFYAPEVPGDTAACAYLVTAEQFDDIHSQEPPCYDRILDLGTRDGTPLRTFTSVAAREDVTVTAPSGPYLATMTVGLREVFGWSSERAQAYLRHLRR